MNSKKYGTILPGTGIGDVILGMSKSDVQKAMGEPDEIIRDGFPDGSDYETFEYPSHGLSFDFGSENNYCLDTIRIERSDIQLFDRCITGLAIQECLALFESHSAPPEPDSLSYIDDNKDQISAYDFDSLALAVWFLNDSLNVVQVSPFWKDEETQIFPWKDRGN